jgi:hypothetical protein
LGACLYPWGQGFKTEIGTASRWETSNSNWLGPIKLSSQSETGAVNKHDLTVCLLHWSKAPPRALKGILLQTPWLSSGIAFHASFFFVLTLLIGIGLCKWDFSL